jgi:hypothetical protein
MMLFGDNLARMNRGTADERKATSSEMGPFHNVFISGFSQRRAGRICW